MSGTQGSQETKIWPLTWLRATGVSMTWLQAYGPGRLM
jgi:hypothetical protein